MAGICRLVATSFAVFVIASAHAQTWLWFEASDKSFAFMDAESIRGEPSRLLVWVMIDYLDPQSIEGRVYRSVLIQHVVNCASREQGTRSIIPHPGQIGMGEPVGSVTREQVPMSEPPPESMGSSIVKTACAFANPQRDLTTYPVLLSHTGSELITLGAMMPMDTDPKRPIALVTRTLYRSIPAHSGAGSACQGYVISCREETILVRPLEATFKTGRMCTGESLPYKEVKPAEKPAAWETKLIKAVCSPIK